jgi:hypothetical protein
MEKFQVSPLSDLAKHEKDKPRDGKDPEMMNDEVGVTSGFAGARDRLAGALGQGDVDRGFDLISKAGQLVVAIVGVGRAGSWVALRLCQSGIGSNGAVILIDADVVEASNVDSMVVPRDAVGHPKVDSVAATVARLTGFTGLMCFQASVSDPAALAALKTADVVFTAVDEPAARLAVATAAARYHLVHIDITGGQAWTDDGHAATGGEVRGFVPGTGGCLGCMDEYDWEGCVNVLEQNPEQHQRRRQRIDWHRQRPGSSADILLPVVGEATQLFWAIVAGDVRESLWWHYERDRAAGPVWSNWSKRRASRRARSSCNICGTQAGLGDYVESR